MIESIIDYKPDSESLLIELTEVKPSKIEGIGLFAKVFIPKGTIWWKASLDNVLLLSRDQYNIFMKSYHNPLVKKLMELFSTYAYYVKKIDTLIFSLDNSGCLNKSVLVAIRRIGTLGWSSRKRLIHSVKSLKDSTLE